MGFAQSIFPSVLSSGQIEGQIQDIHITSTVGQLITPTAIANDFIVTQGFQQPNLEVLTSIQALTRLDDQVKVFPNPCKEFIQIESNLAFTHIELYDVGQKRVLFSKAGYPLQYNQSLDLSGLSYGTYFVLIHTKNQPIVKKISKQ